MPSRPTAALLGLLSALMGTGVALAATPHKGAHYSGHTKQSRTISFDVSVNGKRIVHPIVYLQTHCYGGGNSYAQTSAHATSTASGVIKHGRFQLRFTEHAMLKSGVKATARFAIDGRFTSAKRARGTARVTVHYSNRVECLSGAVSFRVNG